MAKDVSLIVDNVKLNYRTAVILCCGENVLLHKPNADDFWNMPGGRVKFGEDSLSALKREISEELGYEIEESKLIAFGENFFTYRDVFYHELVTIYKVEVASSEKLAQMQGFTSLDNPDMTYHWFNKKEVANIKCLPKIIYSLVDKENDDVLHFMEK